MNGNDFIQFICESLTMLLDRPDYTYSILCLSWEYFVIYLFIILFAGLQDFTFTICSVCLGDCSH